MLASAMSDTFPDIATLSFELALKELEAIVRQLESGEVPLDESIGLYGRGEALRNHCQARLDAAQARIDKIVQGPDGAMIGTAPFDPAGTQ
jgi:exodeoxyribonuclease VII small subunit